MCDLNLHTATLGRVAADLIAAEAVRGVGLRHIAVAHPHIHRPRILVHREQLQVQGGEVAHHRLPFRQRLRPAAAEQCVQKRERASDAAKQDD